MISSPQCGELVKPGTRNEEMGLEVGNGKLEMHNSKHLATELAVMMMSHACLQASCSLAAFIALLRRGSLFVTKNNGKATEIIVSVRLLHISEASGSSQFKSKVQESRIL